MSNEKPATKTDERVMEYIPFGATEKIKLSVNIVKNLICVPTKSGKRCTDQDAIKFLMLCQAKGLNPFENDAFLIGYDNRDGGATYSLITAHQAFLKRAELNAQYDGMESGIIYRVNDEDELIERQGDFFEPHEKVEGGWAKVFFKNRSKPMYKRLRMSRFKKSFGIWQEDDAGMIVKCAEADALRSAFPTMLGGLYLKEEVEGKTSNMNTVTPVFNNPEPAAPPTVDVESEKQPEGPSVATLRKMCADSGISENELMDRLISDRHVDKGAVLDDLDGHQELIVNVVDNWEKLTKRKETSGKKNKDSNV